jgi:outer membrane protein assembly factor BamB
MKRMRFTFIICLLLVTNNILISGQQSVTFALLTDLHVNPGSASDTSLKFLVDEINRTDVDFTVVTGDLSNEGSDAELNAVKKSLDKLIKPCYVLPGNHETNWSESAGTTFNKLWGNDRFMFKLKGFLFVGFNTGPFMKMGDGNVKQEDLQWIKNQLIKQKSEKDILISFSHYPLNEGLDNWIQTTGILRSFGCRIDFCGHGHQIAILNFNGIIGIMGRSMLMGNSRLPGYNIVSLRNDSVLLFNKSLSGKMDKPVIRLNYLKPDTLEKLPISPVQDFSVNEVYKKRIEITEWSDTASIFTGPCLVNDSILVYGNSLGIIKAISTHANKNLWYKQFGGPVYSTPVISKKALIVGTVEGNIIGIDPLSGRLLWEVKTARPVMAEGIVEDEYVYIGGGDGSFYKIETGTGNIVWKFSGVKGLIQGRASVSGPYVVFGAWDRYIYCLNKASGSLIWKWSNGKPQALYSPGNIVPVCSGEKVFIVAPDRYMTAISIGTGKEIWRTGKHQVRESMGASTDGSMIYAKLMNDTIIAVSAKTNIANTSWSLNAGFGYEHNPCPILATKDIVVASTRNGLVVGIDPAGKDILWKYKAGTSSVNKVIVDSHQTLWMTLTEGKIIGIKTFNVH